MRCRGLTVRKLLVYGQTAVVCVIMGFLRYNYTVLTVKNKKERICIKMKKKIISTLLALSMLIPFASQCVVYGEDQTGDNIVISATGGDDTVQIKAAEELPSETTGLISLSYDSSQVVEKDYMQKVLISAENISDNSESFYLSCDNRYEDIYMNFVLSGSKDAPVTLISGETQEIELSVFAQNAKDTVYDVPVRAYSTDGTFLASVTIRIRCNAVISSVEFEEINTNESTLATEYEVTNISNRKIPDMALLLDGTAANYAKISPSVENCELDAGEKITVKVIPDLSKIKNDGLTSIDGSIKAEGGATGEVNFTVDVEGKHITSSYAGNLQIGWDYEEETETLVITGGGAIPDFEEGLVPWSKYSYSAKRIIIGNYVESIGSYSFTDFNAVEAVYLPQSLYSIGDFAFSGCDRLKEINFVGTEEDWEKIEKSQGWNASAEDAALTYGIYNYYQLNDISEVKENTVSVNMTNITSASVLVEIFDEESGELCAYGEQSAAPMTASIDVAIDTGAIPEYFVVKVTMLDKNRKLMCEALENEHHTKKFVDFFAKKASDFEQEKVVNLDEQQDMNFFVASDDVTVIDTDGTVNVVSEGDSENTYTISKATEDVLSLSSGDKVVIRAANAADSFAAKIREMNVTDNTVKITVDDNIAVSEFFSYAKLEMMDGDASSEMMSVMGIGDEIEETRNFKYTIPEDDGAKATVTFSLNISVKISFYYDPQLLGDDYLELNTSVTLKPQIEAHCEDEYTWNYDYALGPGFNIISQVGIGLSIQPSAVVHLEAMAELTATANGTYTVGFNYISTEGGKGYGEVNGNFKLETEAKLMMQAGIALHISVNFLRAINIAVISPEFGVQVDGTTSYTYTTEQEEFIHDCFICIDGNADLYTTADVVVLPLGDKVLWEKEDIYRYTYDIGDFYISEPKLGDPFKFEWGDCKNMAYRLDVYVTDKSNGNSPVPGESVAISGSGTGGEHSGPETLVTDSNGYCSTYLSSGSFTASCRDKVKSFSMGDKVKTVKIVLGEPDPPEDGKDNIPNGGSADYNTSEGRQCTNAGQTTTNLYISENDINDIEKIYETGRMYDGRPYGNNQGYAEDRFGGDKYIHHDKNVDTVYRVNGANINVPSSSGLTDVYITDLSEAIPYLKSGQNTIVRDYDTDAGHYDVVANREITIIYSNNKQVSYVETPDSEETRLLPDFAVYPETVYLENTAIINEENKGTAKIYNRGSLGGWVDVTITDGVNELYSETNKYMPEFSMAEINFAYTPQSKSSSIVVTLENKGLLNEDKDESNNTAEHNVTARERMIPVIDGIAPENIRIDADSLSKGTEIIADISSAKDVESVSFKINGIECSQSDVSLTQSENDNIRASVSVRNVADGVNEVTVLVNYYAGQTIETAEAAKTVNVSLIDPIKFTADDTVVNPTFRIYKNGEMDKQVNSSAEGYIINPTAEMEKQPDQYKLIMICDGGIAAMKLSELDGSVISLKDGKKLSVLTDGNTSIRDLRISAIDDTSVSMYPDLPETNELTLVDIESMNISLYYDIATGENDKATVTLRQNVDLTSENCVIDLTKSYVTYEFQINDEINNGYDTAVYYTTPEYTSNIYPYVSYDANTKKMFVTIGGNDYGKLSDAQSTVLRLSFDNTVYIEDLNEYSDAVVLDKSNNNKISFTCDAENTRISYVEFWDGRSYGTFDLEDGINEIYMPDGEYEIYLSYTVGDAYAIYRQKVNLSGSDVALKLPVKAFDMDKISAEWPKAFDKASLRYFVFDSEGNEFSGGYDNIAQSQSVQVPVGEQTVSIDCAMTDENGNEIASLSMYKNIDVKKGKPLSISFGGNLTADLKIYSEAYSAGDKMIVNLSNIVDENGAYLDYYDAYRDELALIGYLVLTNKTDSAKTYRIPVSTSDMYDGKGIGIAIPYTVEAGEYLYSMKLSNTGELSDSLGISAMAGSGGSISPSGFVEANPGENITFTISPDSGYAISDVLIDGVSVGNVHQYTFENITQSHTILAQFEKTSTNRGGGGGGASSSCTVRFESNGGSSVANVTVNRNDIISEPTTPVRDGYIFDGWYTDADLTEKYDFSTKVTKSFTLYAKWVEKEAGIAIEEWKNPFKDVNEEDWFFEIIKTVNKRGLMLGVSDDIFAPNDSITRAMFVTILHRLEGEPQTGSTSFTDVKEGIYYEKAVAWATFAGIVNGVSNTEFAPDSYITREQIAAMIYRYAQHKGISVESGDMMGNFIDVDKISDYAVPAISWVVNKEIMNGKGNGMLDPLDNATRAEAAAMLIRLTSIM